MWEAIAYVSGGVSLAAFIVAVGASVYKSALDRKVRLIAQAPEEDRARLVKDELEFFAINTEKLSSEQMHELAIRQIEEKAKRFKTTAVVVVILAAFAAAISVFALARERGKPPPPSPPPPTPTPVKCAGIVPRAGDHFSVSDNYDPSGFMGGIDDIKIRKLPEGVTRFTYEPTGRGAQEWDYTYVRGTLNPTPAPFAGVMYLSSPNNWAEQPGYDLRGFGRRLKWDARSLAGPVNVTFVVGGVSWAWDHAKKEKNYDLPCPDSMPRAAKVKTLTDDWQTFDWDLSDKAEGDFSSVVGGFAWMIELNSNGAELNPARPRRFEIELRNIRYER
jgi:hypothetical protein